MKTRWMVLMLTVLLGFNQDKGIKVLDGYNLENKLYLSIKNAKGQNLLDFSTENALVIDDIGLYYQTPNGVREVTIENGFNMGGLELTSSKLLVVPTAMYASDVVEETSRYKIVKNVTYLKFSDADTDTLKTHSLLSKKTSHSNVKGSYFLLSKVWCNGKLVWERGESDLITIIKNN